MVQQPVIQLVQELTMTAVVERHDCTDLIKRKLRSSRPSLNPKIHTAFLASLKISLKTSQVYTELQNLRTYTGIDPKVLKRNQTTDTLPLKKMLLGECHSFLLGVSQLTSIRLEGKVGEKECSLSKPGQFRWSSFLS